MKIVVLLKQVPDTLEIQIDKETGTLIRKGVPTITNPDDLAGLEEALRIRDKVGGSVTVMTMGPPQAEEMLRELLARGADDAVLLTDAKFAGSDTWATSNALAAAVKQEGFDLVICGRQAIDGDTAQVGPQVAEKLGVPQVTYVCEIMEVEGGSIVVKKSYEDHYEVLEAPLPCVITTLSEMNQPRYMDCRLIIDAAERPIRTVTFDSLGISESLVGLKSSPTNVARSFGREVTTETNKYAVEAEAAVKIIMQALEDAGLLNV